MIIRVPPESPSDYWDRCIRDAQNVQQGYTQMTWRNPSIRRLTSHTRVWSSDSLTGSSFLVCPRSLDQHSFYLSSSYTFPLFRCFHPSLTEVSPGPRRVGWCDVVSTRRIVPDSRLVSYGPDGSQRNVKSRGRLTETPPELSLHV